MDREAKSFFEKLSGVGAEDEEMEPHTVRVQRDDDEEDDFSDDETEGHLTVDVYQAPNAFVLESAVAGVAPEDIDVSATPESITIRGRRERTEKVRGENYLYQECYWGRFSRTVILPEEIDPDKVQAAIKNGVLRVTLPKLNKKKTKKVKVKGE